MESSAGRLPPPEDAAAHPEVDLARFFSVSLDPLCVAGLDGRFRRLNRAFEQILGFTPDELLAIPIVSLVHPEDLAPARGQLARLACGEPVFEFECRLRCKDGSYRWLLWNASSVLADGLVYAAARDITIRKRAEEALRRSEARFAAFMDHLPAAAFIKDGAGQYLFLNPVIRGYLGLGPAGPSDTWPLPSPMPPEVTAALRENDRRVLLTGEAIEAIERVSLADGSARTMLSVKFPLSADPGELLIGGIALDITERERAEAERRELLAREQAARQEAEAATAHFRALFESAPGVYLVLRPDDLRIAGVSEAYLDATMTRRDEIVGRHMFEVFPDDPGEPDADGARNLRASLERVRQERCADTMAVQRYPIPRPASEGGGFEERFWSTVNSPVFGPGGELAYIIHRIEDVTDYIRLRQGKGAGPGEPPDLKVPAEHMAAEIVQRGQELQRLNERLRASEERYRSLFETMAQGVVYQDADGAIVSANPAAERILGLSLAQMQGRQSTDPRWHAISEDGSAFPGEAHPAMVALRTGGPVHDVVMGVYNPADDRHRWLNVNARPQFRPGAPRPFQVYATFEDITARKDAEAEVRRLNAELEVRVVERTSQLEAAIRELEAFSYSVSHDLRAPLRAIDGFSRIVWEEYAGQVDEEAREYLRLVRDNTRHMGKLIDDLLAFSRLSRQPFQVQEQSMEALVRRVLEDTAAEREGRAVELLVEPMPPCVGDPALLRQVWANLIANAVKYTRQRPIARITIGSRELDGATVYFISDNGVGFDMRYAHKLFGVFQRLHRAEEYEGTGVGLAIVQRVIHRHGGRVWGEAEPGHGATFSFTIPGGPPVAQPEPPRS